jgi:hypothetical protein
MGVDGKQVLFVPAQTPQASLGQMVQAVGAPVHQKGKELAAKQLALMLIPSIIMLKLKTGAPQGEGKAPSSLL